MIGLKENVIIGKLIPAGTGMKRYRNIKLSTDTYEGEAIAPEQEYSYNVNNYYEDYSNFDYEEELDAEEDYEAQDGESEGYEEEYTYEYADDYVEE